MMQGVQVRKKSARKGDATLLSMMVESASDHILEPFDESCIMTALMEEMGLSKRKSEEITLEVIERLKNVCSHGKIQELTTSMIRSFINTVLYDRGVRSELKSVNDTVVSAHNVTTLIENANKENGNLEHNPESINFSLAEYILKDYALNSNNNIFTKDVVKAHLEGKIYIHDCGAITRAYCSGHSVEYIKLNGIKNIPNIMSTSDPANSAWTLARHVCSATLFYAGIFAGALGWDAVNVFFAPLLVGWKFKDMKQLAQTLVFDLSQLSGAKGGQTAFTDFNIYLTVPRHYRETIAVGKGGKFLAQDALGNDIMYDTREDLLRDEEQGTVVGLRYKDFEKEAQQFAKAIFSVIEHGDAAGVPFAFPKINMHINEDVFNSVLYVDGKGYVCQREGKTLYFGTIEDMDKAIEKDFTIKPEIIPNKEGQRLLMIASKASSKSGCPYFIFDRNGAGISQCCRLNITFSEDDLKLLKTPEDLRFVGVQNVTINLPGTALDVGGDEDRFKTELYNRMVLAVKAHKARMEYLKRLMAVDMGPLKFYNKGMDGKPYVNLDKGSYLIGIVGLNECVYNLIGQELHESEEAFLKGMEIISYMYMKCKTLGEEYGLGLKLEETPAESASLRLATVDVNKHGDKAFVQKNDVGHYYTNSIHFAYDSDVDYMDRLVEQSKFHDIVEAGSMIHLWVGDRLPDYKAIFNTAKFTWYKTRCTQWVISPELTVCRSCWKTTTGLHESCPKCGGEDIFQLTRVTGYYAIVDKFNKGKRAELLDRRRDMFEIN